VVRRQRVAVEFPGEQDRRPITLGEGQVRRVPVVGVEHDVDGVVVDAGPIGDPWE
jgi:hypothetical protein